MSSDQQYKPWMPFTEYDNYLIMAAKAMASGTANTEQQQAFMDMLINGICRTHDLPYFPESQRDTDFALGMQHVGKQVLKLVKMDTSKTGDRK